MDLQYYKMFNEDTSQGIVGLLRPLKNSYSDKKVFRLNQSKFLISATDYFFVEDEPAFPIYVFKISKDVNTLVDHEFKISKDIEDLSICLPHFNRIFEVKRNVKCLISNSKEKVKNNPFLQYNCIRDVAIIEYIPSKLTFLKYIKENNFSGCSYSLLQQLILALFIAQQEKQFTHYDLHLENILLRRCYKRTFFLYKFSYENAHIHRLVYTNGYFPVLFDYGFAYSKGLENTNFNNSLFFTNKGYTPFMFDEINDFKTIMVRLTYIKNCPEKIKKFTNENFLKSNHFKFLLSKETGWIKTTIPSMSKIVAKKLEQSIISIESNYKKNFIYCELDNIIDLFSTLIKLPISQNDFNENLLNNVVKDFITEWEKIDQWFSSVVVDDKLNIIKKIFEIVNDLINDVSNDKNIDIEQKFKTELFKVYDTFGDFVNIQDLNYGKFLTSIIQLSNFIESIFYSEIKRYKKTFNFNMNSWTLFTLIEDLISPLEPYKFELNDSIVLFDCIEKSTSSFELKDSDVIKALNLSFNINDQIELLTNLHFLD